ncbi:MAG: hypothetical protein DMF86_00385 [Acidobacteria bacterium]|nr:MAG: hypothetical protein DMF86_00385 [Acidobacteriota bacterium]
MVLPAALVAVALTAAQQPGWDRTRLGDALDRMIVSGEPRHVDHDEGQELQALLTTALGRDDDPELKSLAIRAAIPVVPRIDRPLFSPADPGSLHVRASRVLTLPWAVAFTATLEARPDSGAWRRVARIPSGRDFTERLDRVFPRAWLSPGFHDLQVRARIQYDALPDGLPREETRALPSLHYGVWSGAIEARAVTRFVERGRYVSVARLDAGLPDVPLAIWLMQLPYAEPGVEAYRRTEWCTLAAHPSGEGQTFSDVCSVAAFQAPQGTVAEVWVKIGDVVIDGEQARWAESEPSLEGAFLRRSGRAPIRLALLPTLVTAAEQAWPAPALLVRPADITVNPAAPRPGRPVALQVVVTNNGSADAYGVTIDVLAGSTPDGTGRPILHRRFIRDIPAGGQVELTAEAAYPLGFGWIMAHAMLLSDHAEWPVTDPESAVGQPVAIHIVNAAAAPQGYTAAICRHATGQASCAAMAR